MIMGLDMNNVRTIIGFCSAYGVSSCPFSGSVPTATSMHTKLHLLNACARGLHCVYVSLVLCYVVQYRWMARKIESLHSNAQEVVQAPFVNGLLITS